MFINSCLSIYRSTTFHLHRRSGLSHEITTKRKLVPRRACTLRFQTLDAKTQAASRDPTRRITELADGDENVNAIVRYRERVGQNVIDRDAPERWREGRSTGKSRRCSRASSKCEKRARERIRAVK